MTPRALTIAVIAAIAALLGAGCKRVEKRVLRTEPWPAPAVASSSPLARAGVVYHVERGTIRVDLSTRKAKPLARIDRLEGRIDVYFSELARTRGNVRVDLLALSVSEGESGETDPALTRRAFDWLELGSALPEADRQQNRWAELRVTALEIERDDPSAPAGAGKGRQRRRGHALAYAELTLHRFRVPMTLELEIERGDAESIPDSMSIRTRRPFAVPLTAHDILPRASDGTVLTESLTSLGSAVAREARVSAEIVLKRTP